jgi:hypothetical protein
MESKKIQLFPVEIEITSALGVLKESAYKINTTGMILEVHSGAYMPQMHVQMKWTLPLESVHMQTNGIVIKTYNQHRGDKMQYLIEIHFEKLQANQKNALQNFMDKVEGMTKS